MLRLRSSALPQLPVSKVQQGDSALLAGFHNTLANEFVRHAAKLQPRLIVLVVPPETLVPQGYKMSSDERTVMKDQWVAVMWLPDLSI